MLLQTLSSFLSAGWEDIIVADNSPNKVAWADRERLYSTYGVSLVITTPVQLFFNQLQNFMIQVAVQNNWAHYFWSHSDVFVLSDKVNVKERAVEELLRMVKNDPTIGVVFFSFDKLAGVITEAYLKTGPWHLGITHYYSDCEYYNIRLPSTGYHSQDAPPIIDVYDMKFVLEEKDQKFLTSRDSSYAKKTSFLKLRESEMKASDYKWRDAENDLSIMSAKDKQAFHFHYVADGDFYRAYNNIARAGVC